MGIRTRTGAGHGAPRGEGGRHDHGRDAAGAARHGRRWMAVGRGRGDPRGRPSEVRLDRLRLLPPGSARREGAALDRAVFDEVVTALRAVHRD